MMPERWDQISQLFESALDLKPEERLAYLEAQCGADESLRREVELLLDSHKKANEQGFIDSPAAERAAPLFAEADDDEPVSDRLEAGQRISHYLINKKLGAGGMGEVYLAKDTTLDRTVALKILPADVASDKRRMQRFKQEAKIASALNQPNIVTIFEFGESGPLHFIVTEHIDGETLRQYLRTNQVKLSEILDISIQLVAALDVAHEAKIIHRDIKPENIMIRRRDNLVKVLDFGLAKLERTSAGASDTEAPTQTLFKTAPGMVMGTIDYMSPEQAQGFAVDERTDIWSTGVVIYEMVAGHAPFKGVTASHTVVEILEREPPALSQTQGAVPPELERIISKALAKNPEERYQSAKDMLIDLRNLRKRLELDAELERSAAPPTLSTSRTTSRTPPAPSTSTSERSDLRSARGWKLILGVLVAAVALIGVLTVINSWRASRSQPVASVAEPVPDRTLNYWILVQKYRDGKPYQEPFRLAREIVFEKDYRIRLTVSSPDDGYFYLLNEGPQVGDQSEQYITLFPSPTANEGSAYLVRNQEIQIPQESWFQFDDEAGTEKLWVVWSGSAVAELEAVKKFANPEHKGLIADPALSQAVKSLLDRHSASKPQIRRIEELRLTTINSPGDILVHQLKLEHY